MNKIEKCYLCLALWENKAYLEIIEWQCLSLKTFICLKMENYGKNISQFMSESLCNILPAVQYLLYMIM